jgi:cellulose synthase/poly-beta-1,6-N-acetylglucosamine synthase-like glycosyltransferase
MILEIMTSFCGIFVMILMIYQLFLSLFGFKKREKGYKDHAPQSRFLVLVPAHNEETVIPDIIENLSHLDYPKELYDFYIIADNCTDRTEDVARQMGANVIVLHKEHPDDPTGKPIALHRALNILEGYQDNYDMLMIFDADNLLDPDMLLELNSQYISENKPEFIQCYLGAKNKKGLVAWFYYVSYTITNRFFQLAKYRLGLNCSIGGTGFATSTQYLYQRGGWTTKSLTEDFEIQVEATLAGKRIAWNHNVRVYDEKPTTAQASYRQRTRWAQGHWFVTFRNTPKIMRALWKGEVSVWEAISMLTYMYSLTVSFVVVIFQFISAAVFHFMDMAKVATTAEAMIKAAAVAQTAQGTWFSTVSSMLIFCYSFFFLFYLADWLDNHSNFRLRTLPMTAVSFLLNMMLATCSQITGLFLHRRQNQWVKTEHRIRLKRLDKGKEVRLPARASHRPALLAKASSAESADATVAKAGAK